MARQQRKMMAMQVAMTRERYYSYFFIFSFIVTVFFFFFMDFVFLIFRLPWFVGVASFFTLGALGAAIRGHLQPAVAAPLVMLWTITGSKQQTYKQNNINEHNTNKKTGYQWDMAYWTKANRINDHYNDVMKEKFLWFAKEEQKQK
jgi:hypothetical protein